MGDILGLESWYNFGNWYHHNLGEQAEDVELVEKIEHIHIEDK